MERFEISCVQLFILFKEFIGGSLLEFKKRLSLVFPKKYPEYAKFTPLFIDFLSDWINRSNSTFQTAEEIIQKVEGGESPPYLWMEFLESSTQFSFFSIKLF